MNPLLDLYIYLNDEIPFSKYEEAMDDFDQLWGANIHVFTDNLSESKHLCKLLDFLQSSSFMSYSFIDGTEVNKFNNIAENILTQLKAKNVNALAVPINKKLIIEEPYRKFFSYNDTPKLETYLKISKENISDLDEIIAFMLKEKIRLCIVDIEKSPFNNKKLEIDEYEACVSKLRKYNEEEDIRFSIIECPYPKDGYRLTNTQPYGGCCGGISSCMIDYDGSVVPCHYLKNFPQGNIRTERLKNIWQNSDLFSKLRNRKNMVQGTCQKCKFLLSCGGCRAESYYKYNSLFEDDPYCFIKQMEKI